MPERSPEATEPGTRPDRWTSLGRLVACWFLVGTSLSGLALDVHDAVSATLPVSPVTGALLFSLVVPAALWTAERLSTVRDSAVYFVAELSAHLLLALALLRGAGSGWPAVGVRLAAMAGAATLAFTSAGYRARRWTRATAWRLLKTQNPAIDEE